MIERLEPVLADERPDLVLVPGDVNSTLAAALAAAKSEIPLGHVESGLRSFDRSMPEEVNRSSTDQFSELLFLHSEEAAENLRREGIADERMHFVGNTMIDTLVALEPTLPRPRNARSSWAARRASYLLVTLHRPALVDGPLLGEAMSSSPTSARELPVVFPVHPRTRKHARRARSAIRASRSLHPLGYLDFLSLEAERRRCSPTPGGIQEETTFLGVPCFTLRDNTERPVTVRAGTNTVLGLDPARIAEIPELLAERSGERRDAAAAVGRTRGRAGRRRGRVAPNPVRAEIPAVRAPLRC